MEVARMTWQKVIAPGETVGLKFSAADRKLVIDCPYVMDCQLHDRVRDAARKEDVPFTLDELEDLHGYLAFDANHTEDRKRERALDKILFKIEEVLDTCIEAMPTEDSKVGALQSAESSSSERKWSDIDYVPTDYRELYSELVALTDKFCSERLNAEYQELCREMAIALCQAGTPAVRGKPASWASGIVYSVGWVNFLADPSQEPHIRSEDIAKWFGVSVATMLSKSKVLREGLDLMPFDPTFTLPSRLDDNPLVWMVELINGFIIDIRHAPRELQVQAYEAGMIPYVPADRGDASMENAEK
jgi:hypothetical protein